MKLLRPTPLAVVVLAFGVLAASAGGVARIASVDPSSAPRGADVELRGAGFGAKNVKVWVGGVPARVLSAAGDVVRFRVPETAPLGPTTVEAANPGGKRSSAPFNVIWTGDAVPLLATSQAVSATIGRDGGSLESQGVRLEIPAGALSEPVALTLTPMTGLRQSPLDQSFIGGAKLEPEGLLFLAPATLTMPLPAGIAPSEVVGFGSAGDGSELHLQPHSVADGTIGLRLWHFSTAGAAAGGSAAARAMQTHTPSSAERQALQRIAVANQACNVEVAQGVVDGPACADVVPESVRALFAWYTNAVKPGLQGAGAALSFEAEEALAEWLAWEAEVRLLFRNSPAGTPVCGTLQSECVAANALATSAVGAHVQRRLDNCTGTSLASQLRDVARMADFAGAGAIDLTTVGLPDATGGALLRACAHLEIDVLSFPAVAAIDFANTLRGRVTVDVFSGPDRTDIPFTLTVGGALVTTAQDGTFQTTLTPTTGLPLNVSLEAEATNPSLQNTAFTDIESLTSPTRQRLQLLAQSSTTVPAGGTVDLLVRVAGDGMAGMTLAAIGGPGSAGPSPVTTNSQGEATAVFTVLAGATEQNSFITAVLPDGTTASVAITIQFTVTVDLSPATAAVSPGGTVNFVATVSNSSLGVTWSATGGEIVNTSSGGSNTARYEAGGTPGTYTVTATSIADPAASASATVEITAASVSIFGTWTGLLSRPDFPDGPQSHSVFVYTPTDFATQPTLVSKPAGEPDDIFVATGMCGNFIGPAFGEDTFSRLAKVAPDRYRGAITSWCYSQGFNRPGDYVEATLEGTTLTVRWVSVEGVLAEFTATR